MMSLHGCPGITVCSRIRDLSGDIMKLLPHVPVTNVKPEEMSTESGKRCANNY